MNENNLTCSIGRTSLVVLEQRSDPGGTLRALICLLELIVLSLSYQR
jgi:hypothetical protein